MSDEYITANFVCIGYNQVLMGSLKLYIRNACYFARPNCRMLTPLATKFRYRLSNVKNLFNT